MQGFVAALLRHEGALVEPIDPEGLEVLAPPPVQNALGISELAGLGFGTTRPPAAQRVGLEGDWLDRFARLLGPQGRFGRRVVSTPARAPGDLERVLRQDLVLDNATFRLIDVAPRWTRYLVLDFRASAVSDDKRDWMVRLGVNLATGALPDAVLAAIGAAVDAPGFDDRSDEDGEGSSSATGRCRSTGGLGSPATPQPRRARAAVPAGRRTGSVHQRSAAATRPGSGPPASVP